METVWKETESRLRGEVEFYREKAKTAEDPFTRKQERIHTLFHTTYKADKIQRLYL